MVMRGLFLSKKIFLIKAGFLAQKHGDSEGGFSDRIFFEEIPGVFADFQTVYEGVKKNPKNSGAFCLFQTNR